VPVVSSINRFNSMKILAHADRLREIADGGMPYPIDWHIYPTNACNHSCSWCMFRQNGEQAVLATLPQDLMLRAVRDAAEAGAVLVHFSGGGEPLLNQYTAEAMELASSLGLAVALSTNGTFLTLRVAETADYLRVSLNAGTEEQHRRTNHSGNGHSDWQGIVQNIKQVAPHRKRDLGLAFVVDHDNFRDIYPFCQVAVECGADFVHIRPAFWYDREADKQTHAIMGAAFQECERARHDFGQQLGIFAIAEKFDGYWTPRSYSRCLATLTGTCLTATGDFAVCQDRTDLRFGVAYREGVSFEEVWHSEEHRQLVDSISSPGTLDECPRCVWNKRNEIIDQAFVKDEIRMAMV
jgi:MoaA/NifB/PqqE/SkfB family radical SAM enzyme